MSNPNDRLNIGGWIYLLVLVVLLVGPSIFTLILIGCDRKVESTIDSTKVSGQMVKKNNLNFSGSSLKSSAVVSEQEAAENRKLNEVIVACVNDCRKDIKTELRLAPVEIELTPEMITPEFIRGEINLTREYNRENEKCLDLYGFNHDFEKRSYRLMRAKGFGASSEACQRLVIRAYEFDFLLQFSEVAKKFLALKESSLLKLYDVVQIRERSDSKTLEKLKAIKDETRSGYRQEVLKIKHVQDRLDHDGSRIPSRDWHIGDPDKYMGYAH